MRRRKSRAGGAAVVGDGACDQDFGKEQQGSGVGHGGRWPRERRKMWSRGRVLAMMQGRGRDLRDGAVAGSGRAAVAVKEVANGEGEGADGAHSEVRRAETATASSWKPRLARIAPRRLACYCSWGGGEPKRPVNSLDPMSAWSQVHEGVVEVVVTFRAGDDGHRQ